jgi:WD40 repeat protein
LLPNRKTIMAHLPSSRPLLGLLALGCAFAGTALAVQPRQGSSPDRPAERTDALGDPLPPGARLRLGTTRWWRGTNPSNLAWSADGKLLASGGADVILHDAESGKLLRRVPLAGPCAVAPDGRRVAAWCTSQELVRVWDVSTGKEVFNFAPPRKEPGPSDPLSDLSWSVRVGFVAYSPDGKLLAAGGERTVVADAATGKEVVALPGDGGPATAGAFSPDGKRLVTGGYQAAIVWDVSTGKAVHKLNGFGDVVAAVAFTPDGKQVFSAGWDQTVRLWDATTGKAVRRLTGDCPFLALAVSPDGKLVAAGAQDGSVRLWDVASGEEVRRLDVGGEPAQGLAFSPDGKTLASGGERVSRWDVATGKPIAGPASADGSVLRVAFAPDGKTLAVGSGSVHLWDTATGKRLARVHVDRRTDCLAFFPDGKALLTGGDQRLALLEVPGLKALAGLARPADLKWWGSGASAPDGRTVAVIQYPGIALWDVRAGKELRRFGDDPEDRRCLAFAPDGSLLASGGLDKKVRLWDPATGKEVGTLEGHETGVYAVAFAPGGAILASAAEQIRLWEVRTGKEVGRLEGGCGLAFSPDGRLLATCPGGGVIAVYDLATGKVVRRLASDQDLTWALAFSPDGATLASGGSDTTVLLWDVKGLRPAARTEALTDQEAEALWADLAGNDAAAAYRAVGRLAESAGEAARVLKERVPPAAADERRVARLIKDLDSDEFAARQRAAAELEGFVELAVPALRKALDGKPSAEVRRQAEALLAKVEAPTGEGLRRLRAVEALALAGGPEERKVLAALAAGAAEARVTREAREALRRLGEGP